MNCYHPILVAAWLLSSAAAARGAVTPDPAVLAAEAQRAAAIAKASAATVAATVALLGWTGAQAQSSVTIYGLLDAALTTYSASAGTALPGGAGARVAGRRAVQLDSGVGPGGSRIGFIDLAGERRVLRLHHGQVGGRDGAAVEVVVDRGAREDGRAVQRHRVLGTRHRRGLQFERPARALDFVRNRLAPVKNDAGISIIVAGAHMRFLRGRGPRKNAQQHQKKNRHAPHG